MVHHAGRAADIAAVTRNADCRASKDDTAARSSIRKRFGTAWHIAATMDFEEIRSSGEAPAEESV